MEYVLFFEIRYFLKKNVFISENIKKNSQIILILSPRGFFFLPLYRDNTVYH